MEKSSIILILMFVVSIIKIDSIIQNEMNQNDEGLIEKNSKL